MGLRLVVSLGVAETSASTALYSVQVQLVEPVRLLRNDEEAHAVSWSRQMLGLVAVGQARGAIRQAVVTLVAGFVEAVWTAS